MTRKLKKGGYAAILSVIVIAAVVLLNMIVGRLPEKVRQWTDLYGGRYDEGASRIPR